MFPSTALLLAACLALAQPPQLPAERPDPADAARAEKERLKKLGAKFIAKGYRASWSPDGDKLVYGVPENEYGNLGAGLAVYDFRTARAGELSPSGKDPAWAPHHGRLIAYVDGGYGPDEEVWLLKPDGTGRRKVAVGGFPTWSADGQTLYYHDHARGKVMAQSLKEGVLAGEPREVLTTPHYYPVPSPPPLRFAVQAADKLAVIDAATGKPVGEWRRPPSRGVLAGWSPDGKWIGLGGYGFTDPVGLWLLKADTGELRKVADGSATLPAWSPDGHKIAFDVRLPTGMEVWVMDAKGLDKLPVVTPPGTTPK